MSARAFFVALAAAALASSCNEAEDEFTNEPCFLVFDNSVHQNATLASAMDVMSPGVFCRISTTERSGVTYFLFENNHGQQSEPDIANAIDQQRTFRLGRHNGIIVGYGNADITAPVFCAYDDQCPNCYTGTGLVDRSLDMSDSGIASCPNCHCAYDMNNGGIISAGSPDREDGDRLTRYRNARTTGAYGVLSVTN